jgi:UDP-N-acetylglucosamine 3-dehydrogenase
MSAKERIRVGVIGAGRWGIEHIEAYRSLPDVDVVAVADNSPEVAERAAKTFGIPRWFTTYQDLCRLGELDAVSVVTPESDHLRPVEEAARSGKHVLVEKPVATEVADVQTMIRAAREAGVILMPGHLLRFETRYALVKEKLDRGELGTIASLQARRNRTKETRRQYARAHPVFAAAIHDIDLLLWYAASKVKRVRGFHRNICGNATPDVMWGMLEFENGILGCLECTWLTPDSVGIPNDDLLQVITDRGIARIEFVHSGLTFWKETGLEIPDISFAPRIRGRVEGALTAELGYFVSCVSRGEQPRVVTAEDGLESIRVARALVESAEKEEDVLLETDRPATMRSNAI